MPKNNGSQTEQPTAPELNRPPAAVSIDLITYAEFREHLRAHLAETTTMKETTIGNYVSGLNRWMTLLGRDEQDFVAPDVSAEHFPNSLGNAMREMEKRAADRKSSTESSNDTRKTQFNALRTCFIAIEFSLSDMNEQVVNDFAPTPFARFLNVAAERKGTTADAVLEQVGANGPMRDMWLRGKVRDVIGPDGEPTTARVFSTPLLDSKKGAYRRAQIEKLEDLLDLPRGKLLSVCKVSVGVNDTGKGQGPYAEQQAKLRKEPYCLRLKNFERLTPGQAAVHMPLVAELMQEIERHRVFKTTDHPELLKLKRHRREKWRIRRRDKSCPTSTFAMGVLSAFFGYALNKHKGPTMLPLGIGGTSAVVPGSQPPAPRNPSLAWLTDYLLLAGYLDFRKERAGGVYNGGVITLLNRVRNMAHPEHGYLTQLAAEYGPKVGQSADEFVQTCAEVHKLATAKVHDLAPLVEASRTKLPVQKILSMQHPLHAIFTLLQNMEKAARGLFVTKESYLRFHRDTAMIALLASNPLRVSHLSWMTYDEDDPTSNLYRNEGRWFLRFPQDSFKNFAGAARHHSYDFPINALATKYLDKYLKTYRPMLGWDKSVKWLFPNARCRSKAPRRSPQVISNQIRRVTVEHIKKLAPSGFGPHAFRHIVATEIIRNQPGGLTIAARVLHDEEETVRMAYSDVEAVDFAKIYTDYSDKLQAAHSEQEASK